MGGIEIQLSEVGIILLYNWLCSYYIYEKIHEKTKMKSDDLLFNHQCEKDVYNEFQLLGEINNLFLSIFTQANIDLIIWLLYLMYFIHLSQKQKHFS